MTHIYGLYSMGTLVYVGMTGLAISARVGCRYPFPWDEWRELAQTRTRAEGRTKERELVLSLRPARNQVLAHARIPGARWTEMAWSIHA